MKLFSKPAILIFSIIGTTLFGAFLFADNLKQMDKKKYIASTIIFAIVWSGVVNAFGRTLPNPLIGLAIANIGGGLILIGPFWEHHVDKDLEYGNRSILGPLISLAVLIGGIIGVFYFLNR